MEKKVNLIKKHTIILNLIFCIILLVWIILYIDFHNKETKNTIILMGYNYKQVLLFCKYTDYTIEDFSEKEIDVSNYIFHLHDSICFEEGITLKDVFLLLDKNVDLFSIAAANPLLDELIKGAFKGSAEQEETELILLEIRREILIKNSEMYEFTDFFGIGDNIVCGLEFASAQELLHYPLLINEIVYIKNDDNGEEKRFRKTFTLLETITSIVNEIGYSQLMSEFNEESIKDLEDEFYDILSTDDLSKKIEEEINKITKTKKILFRS